MAAHADIDMTPDEACILCIGDIDVDIVIAVPEVPGPDEKINGSLVLRSPGGMAANVAVGLARMGVPVRLVAAIGDDENGHFLKEKLSEHGISTDDLIQVDGADTFSCIVMVSSTGEKSLIRVVTDAYLPRPKDVDPAIFAHISHLHMTLGSEVLTEEMFRLAKVHDRTTSLDLEAADLRHANISAVVRILEMTDILFCSEAALASAQTLLRQHHLASALVTGQECSIITRGANGARLISKDTHLEVPGHDILPLDTTGAGDSFVAAFLAARNMGKPLASCLALANAAGALSTQAIGAQTGSPSLEQTLQFCKTPRKPKPNSSTTLADT